MPSNCGAGEESFRVPWTARRSNQSSLRKLTPNTHWKDWSWSSNILVTWCEQLTHWKRPWCLERLRTVGEEGIRGWDSWMASLMQWTWTWASSGRQWGTGRPGVLQSMGLQSQTQMATEQQQHRNNHYPLSADEVTHTFKVTKPGSHFRIYILTTILDTLCDKHISQTCPRNFNWFFCSPVQPTQIVTPVFY